MKFSEYLESINSSGVKTFYLNDDNFWMEISSRVIARSPAFTLKEPSTSEIDSIFENLNPVIITYNVHAKNKNNAYLYYTDDNDYKLEKLDATGRRFARKGKENFEIKFVEWDEIMNFGMKAYADTRSRNGLDDGTKDEFLKRMTSHSNNPAFKAIGAFTKQNKDFAAYLTVIEVDNWVEITSSYSDNDFLKLYPNNGLFDFALKFYLCDKKSKIVSYGVSSIQSKSNKDSLHVFKLRVGFNALPVNRVFITNPKYKFAFNKVSKSAIKMLLKFKKGDRNLLKLEGLFDMLEKEDSE